jgi:hypothetical protein
MTVQTQKTNALFKCIHTCIFLFLIFSIYLCAYIAKKRKKKLLNEIYVSLRKKVHELVHNKIKS